MRPLAIAFLIAAPIVAQNLTTLIGNQLYGLLEIYKDIHAHRNSPTRNPARPPCSPMNSAKPGMPPGAGFACSGAPCAGVPHIVDSWCQPLKGPLIAVARGSDQCSDCSEPRCHVSVLPIEMQIHCSSCAHFPLTDMRSPVSKREAMTTTHTISGGCLLPATAPNAAEPSGAMRRGNTTVFQASLKSSGDPHQRDPMNGTPLMPASLDNRREL
jgi:hypothetical protein